MQFKALREFVNLLNNIGAWSYEIGDLAAIGKVFRNFFILNFDGGDGVATDIGKTIVVGMVVTTFQKNAVREFISNFKIDTYRRDGVRKDFFVMGI